MKLIDLSFSPYSARVRMVVRYKNLPITFEPPPATFRTPAFKEGFPLGKIPILELDDGSLIPESWAIMEFLEDTYPELPLRPKDPLGRAQMRILGRLADIYFGPVLFPIFVALKQSQRDPASDAKLLAAITTEMVKMSHLLDEYGLPDDRQLNLGDIALVQNILFIEMIFPLFGGQDAFETTPLVAKWWSQVKAVPAIAQTIVEFDIEFRKFLKQLGVDLTNKSAAADSKGALK